MPTDCPIQSFLTSHRFLRDHVARIGGIVDPIAVDLDEYRDPLVKAARRGPLISIDGVLVRDWDPDTRSTSSGVRVGGRLYYLGDLRFAVIECNYDFNQNSAAYSFAIVGRGDYAALYRLALALRRETEPPAAAPVLADGQLDTLWKNTVGYLDPANLQRIKKYGGRPKRGVLLMGPPGNGKTSACRWLWQECRERGYSYRVVTPDAYAEARRGCNAQRKVQELFDVEKRGLVFFDDMDVALRDRETVKETDDQAVFLGALDGISVKEGVAFVFTTNCPVELIDRAFKRPGRIDLVMQFDPPATDLRRRLVSRWHPEIRAALDLDEIVESTAGFSFADIEEVKNLLILNFMDAARWDWGWALREFDANRHELGSHRRSLGFGVFEAALNGED
ncbi:MAG: ATP-binding protein [Gemmataceae bacterium]